MVSLRDESSFLLQMWSEKQSLRPTFFCNLVIEVSRVPFIVHEIFRYSLFNNQFYYTLLPQTSLHHCIFRLSYPRETFLLIYYITSHLFSTRVFFYDIVLRSLSPGNSMNDGTYDRTWRELQGHQRTQMVVLNQVGRRIRGGQRQDTNQCKI